MLQKARQETLESQSLWNKWYKFESRSLWGKYKIQVAQVHPLDTPKDLLVYNIMRGIRSIHYPNGLAYVSVPVISGKVLYDLILTQHPLMNKEVQIRKAISHNYFTGLKFLEELRKYRNYPILYLPDLIPNQQWDQAHFQDLRLSIIAEQCTEVHMFEGWEFSNSGSEEFTHVMQLKLGVPLHINLDFWNTKEREDKERERMRNIKIYDHNGSPLTINDGIGAIVKALVWLNDRGFEAETLENSLLLLFWTKTMINRNFYQ